VTLGRGSPRGTLDARIEICASRTLHTLFNLYWDLNKIPCHTKSKSKNPISCQIQIKSQEMYIKETNSLSCQLKCLTPFHKKMPYLCTRKHFVPGVIRIVEMNGLTPIRRHGFMLPLYNIVQQVILQQWKEIQQTAGYSIMP
jgi:hypothetical protein